jgi:hypothetical protein
LIDESLKLMVEERLIALQSFSASIEELRARTTEARDKSK